MNRRRLDRFSPTPGRDAKALGVGYSGGPFCRSGYGKPRRGDQRGFTLASEDRVLAAKSFWKLSSEVSFQNIFWNRATVGRLKLFFVAPIIQHYAKATETGDRARPPLHGRALYRIRAQPHRS